MKIALKILGILAFGILCVIIFFEVLDSIDLVDSVTTPFQPTLQCGIDLIGMFFKDNVFMKIPPLSYVEYVNGIKVENREEFRKVVKELIEKGENGAKFTFVFPSLSEEKTRIEEFVKFYRITFVDYFITFLIPLIFSLVLFSVALVSYFFLVDNIETFSNYKVQMFVSSIVFLVCVGLLILGGVDIVNESRFHGILYSSFAFTNVCLGILFYGISAYKLEAWKYLIPVNILISTVMLTIFYVTFEMRDILLFFVKINYIIISLNVVVGIIMMFLLRARLKNSIEKSRIRLLGIFIFIPAFVLALIFMLQGGSLNLLPISIFIIPLSIFASVFYFVNNDHNLINVYRRVLFFSAIIFSLLTFTLVLLKVYQDVVQAEQIMFFGAYLFPSILIVLAVIWFILNPDRNVRISEIIDINSLVREPTPNLILNAFRKISPSVEKVNIYLNSVTLAGSYPGVNLFLYYPDIFSKLKKFSFITANDVLYVAECEGYRELFSELNADYLFYIDLKSSEGFFALKTKSALTETAINDIMILVRVFSIIFRAVHGINSLRLVKAVRFEFEMIRQAQKGVLSQSNFDVVKSPNNKVMVMNFWEPLMDLAGDMISTTISDRIYSWISDICGKGISAAFLSFSYYIMIEKILLSKLSPLETVKTLNDIMTTEILFNIEDFFLTFSCVAIDYNSLEAEIVNAGNPPILLYRDGEVEEINPKGTIVGIFDNALFESRKIKLKKGDLLLNFSDGLTDILEEQGKMIGEERIIEILKDSKGDPFRLSKHIKSFIDNKKYMGSITDDITFSIIYIEEE